MIETDFWADQLEAVRRLAFHEASHAVASITLGERIVEAALDLQSEAGALTGGGRVEPDLADGEDGPRSRLIGAVVRYAGVVLDRRIGARTRSFEDIQRAIEAVESLVDRSSADALQRRLLELADEIVRDMMPSIERVADGLMAHVTLSGDEVEAIIGNDLGAWSWWYSEAIDAIARSLTR